LPDLGGLRESDVETKAGDRKGPGPRHSGFEEIPTSDCRHRSLPSHRTNEESA
jgi:hypothetical protein